MAYDFYLDTILLPVPPSKLQISIKNHNDTLILKNEGEILIPKTAGLTDISFKVEIPQRNYPHARYLSGFVSANEYLTQLEALKNSLKPFRFIVSRTLPNGDFLFTNNINVILEDYKIVEEAKSGIDLEVDIKLKQYREYSTKTIQITQPETTENTTTSVPPLAVIEDEKSDTGGKIIVGSTVTVNGRLHKDSYGKGAGATRTNYIGKVNFINLKGSHPYHITTPKGSWLGWVTANSVKAV